MKEVWLGYRYFGYWYAMKMLTISPEKCQNCRSCELICSFTKIGEFNPNESAVVVLSYEDSAASIPVMCMHCEDAACMKVCPVSAISRDMFGAVTIDENKCVRCKMCTGACPLGNVFYSDIAKKIIKCDLCGGNPQCVRICPTGAIKYEEGNAANISKKKIVAAKFKDLFAEG